MRRLIEYIVSIQTAVLRYHSEVRMLEYCNISPDKENILQIVLRPFFRNTFKLENADNLLKKVSLEEAYQRSILTVNCRRTALCIVQVDKIIVFRLHPFTSLFIIES